MSTEDELRRAQETIDELRRVQDAIADSQASMEANGYVMFGCTLLIICFFASKESQWPQLGSIINSLGGIAAFIILLSAFKTHKAVEKSKLMRLRNRLY